MINRYIQKVNIVQRTLANKQETVFFLFLKVYFIEYELTLHDAEIEQKEHLPPPEQPTNTS